MWISRKLKSEHEEVKRLASYNIFEKVQYQQCVDSQIICTWKFLLEIFVFSTLLWTSTAMLSEGTSFSLKCNQIPICGACSTCFHALICHALDVLDIPLESDLSNWHQHFWISKSATFWHNYISKRYTHFISL